MYTLTRAAHVRPDTYDSASDMDVLLNERADRENLANSSLDSNTDTEYDSQDESLPYRFTSSSGSGNVVASTSAAALTASSSSSANSNSPAQQRKRQLKITGELRVFLFCFPSAVPVACSFPALCLIAQKPFRPLQNLFPITHKFRFL